jgi:putative addiction module antidote
MLTLKLMAVGFILPKEVMAKLHLHKGDMVYLTETPDGYRLTPYNPDFERQMRLAEKIMHEDRELLRQLAK